MSSYQGKTALVTGASSGIGEAFAKLLAAEGANLILVARREERLQKLAEELRLSNSIQVTIIAMDLSAANAPTTLYQATREKGLTVDVLINNAGVGKHGDFLETSLADHHQTINLNVIALNDLTYLYGQDMAERGAGQILLVASLASFLPIPRFATYAASKAYVLALGESLAKELQSAGVSVTTLCPGGTSTEFMDLSGQQIDGLRKLAMMSSEEVAQAGLKAMKKKQPVVVPGLLYKFSVAGLRFFPRRIQAIFGQLATD